MNKESKLYRLKKPVLSFYCALCRSPREMQYQKNLTTKNYFQIVVASVMLIWILFSLMGFKALFVFFIVWTGFEFVNKLLYRRELPCPHCAFDPTWYRKDVKMARRKVAEFLEAQQQETLSTEEQDKSTSFGAVNREQDNYPENTL